MQRNNQVNKKNSNVKIHIESNVNGNVNIGVNKEEEPDNKAIERKEEKM